MRISTGQANLGGRPHALYRFYDRTDVLLYVGISANLPARFSKHRNEKPWWLQVEHVRIEHFDSRRAALDAEAEAIRDEEPLYNVQHAAAAPVENDCSPGCTAWTDSRNDISIELIDKVKDHLGWYRFDQAREEVLQDMQLPEDEREGWETDEAVETAKVLIDKAAGDLWSFRYQLLSVMRDLPKPVRDSLEREARDDEAKAGNDDPNEFDLLLNILRHLGYLVCRLLKEGSE